MYTFIRQRDFCTIFFFIRPRKTLGNYCLRKRRIVLFFFIFFVSFPSTTVESIRNEFKSKRQSKRHATTIQYHRVKRYSNYVPVALISRNLLGEVNKQSRSFLVFIANLLNCDAAVYVNCTGRLYNTRLLIRPRTRQLNRDI